MARKGLIESNNRKKRTVLRFQDRRASLKKELSRPDLSQEERFRIRGKMQALPRDASLVRVRLRCAVTGRSRGVYRFCGLSRSVLRDAAFSGFLPGVKRSSW